MLNSIPPVESHTCFTTLTFRSSTTQSVNFSPRLLCRCWASAHSAARPASWLSCTIWGDARIYFWSSDFPQAQQLHLLCAIQYKSNRVLGAVQLRDYSDYVILLFGEFTSSHLTGGLSLQPRRRALLGMQDAK